MIDMTNARSSSTILAAALGLALVASPALAQDQPSGGASDGGAIQGGSGAPGGGTGIPGSVESGHSATGVGTSSTGRVGMRVHHRRRHHHG